MKTPHDRQTICLIDGGDHPLMRALETMLRGDGFGVRLFSSSDAMLGACDPNAISCVVAGVSGADALDLVVALADRGSDAPVVALGPDGGAPLVVAAHAAGPPDHAGAQAEIAEVARLAIGEAGAFARFRAQTREAAAAAAELSSRERQVLACMALGLTTKEVAGELDLSPKSIDTYRERLMAKLGARNAAQLTRLAVLASLAPGARRP